MIVVNVAIATVVLLLVTQIGVFVIERMYPAPGKIIEVRGARLHVVELAPPDASQTPMQLPVVMVHGASSNLEALGELGRKLAKTRRVILIDRPGHGWSTRKHLADATPAIQAAMIAEALDKLGLGPALVIAHSWGGALGAALALDHPAHVAGLVLLAPVTHPWDTGVAWYHHVAVNPVMGGVFAYTLALPAGLAMLRPGARSAFQPQVMPDGYVGATQLPLLLRPREFRSNGADMVALRDAVEKQVPRYPAIKAPTIVLHGDADSDRTVSIDIHARNFVKAVPGAELVELKGFGHMLPTVAIDRIVAAVDTVSDRTAALLRAAN